MVRGRNRGNIYKWPVTSSSRHTKPTALAISTFSMDKGHHRLGHPSSQVLKKLTASYSLPVTNSISSSSHCDACLCNKSHKLPFGTVSISCTQPLEVLFIDVWGPAPVISFDRYRYYVIFVDYFTKSDFSVVFDQYKKFVEIFFQKSIKTVYSDGAGEYQSLNHYLSHQGIQHLKSPLHTPQHIGTAKRKHRHIMETAHCYVSCLYSIKMLVSCLSCSILSYQSPTNTRIESSITI